MDIHQIEALAKEGESLCIEFKTSTGQISAAFRTICAFLNGKGGVVLIGIKDKGQIVGQDVTDNTRQEVARELKKIEPSPQVDINYVPISGGKYIIVIETTFGQHAPYIYDGRAYERLESSTGLISQHHYEQLLVRRGQLNHVWEEQPAEGYDIDSLDHDEIRQTIKEGVNKNRIGVEVLNYDIADVLIKLKLMRDGHLNNAAIVLYAKEVQPTFSNCMIRLARFRGKDKLEGFIDSQRIYGNAFRIISAAFDFMHRHLPTASFFEPDNLQRIDQPAVPALALREAIINAISHRSYAKSSASIALAIYDDRLEIWNSGELASELEIDDLKRQHQSYPRNEIIASIFYNRGWVEGWGTGTTRMIGYCKENGTPEPEFEEYSGGFAVIFPFKDAMNTSVKGIHDDEAGLMLTDRQKEILEILTSEGKLSLTDISNHLASSPAPSTLREDLIKLRELDLVLLEGRGKNAKWLKVKTS